MLSWAVIKRSSVELTEIAEAEPVDVRWVEGWNYPWNSHRWVAGVSIAKNRMWPVHLVEPVADTARPTDYGDEITREQVEALNRIVPDDEFSDFKTISGPDG